jgi:hypothetical protein
MFENCAWRKLSALFCYLYRAVQSTPGAIIMARLSMSKPKLQTQPAPLDEKFPHAHANDSYYNSNVHRVWRTLIITRADGRCPWPGCNVREQRMFADHIIEIRDGGSRTDPLNGQCLCAKHHAIKTHRAKLERPFHFRTALAASHG